MDEDQAKKFYDTLMTVEDERIKTALGGEKLCQSNALIVELS